jgi:hypothetical protein
LLDFGHHLIKHGRPALGVAARAAAATRRAEHGALRPLLLLQPLGSRRARIVQIAEPRVLARRERADREGGRGRGVARRRAVALGFDTRGLGGTRTAAAVVAAATAVLGSLEREINRGRQVRVRRVGQIGEH